MKKLLIAMLFIMASSICLAQQPTQVKPANKVLVGPSDSRAKLDKTKLEMQKLLKQYNNQMTAAQSTMDKLEALRKDLTSAMKELESQDKLGNFEIQDLMSQYNQAQTMSSNLLKKTSDQKNSIIQKL